MKIYIIDDRTCFYLKALEHWDWLDRKPRKLRKRQKPAKRRECLTKKRDYPLDPVIPLPVWWPEFLEPDIPDL